jgi:hypothetical protein
MKKKKQIRMRMSQDGQSLILEIPIQFIVSSIPVVRHPPVLGGTQIRIFELMTMEGICEGKELARRMNLTLSTIKYHTHQIYKKLEISGHGDLLRLYGNRKPHFVIQAASPGMIN